MPITEHPLHRSVQAHLMHTALTLGDDAHSPERIGVMEFHLRKPPIDNLFHLSPLQFAAVASATQSFPPHLGDGEPESVRSRVAGHAVVSTIPFDDTLEPLTLVFDRAVHSFMSQFLSYFRQLNSHLLSNRLSEDRVHAVAELYPNNVGKTQEAKSLWFALLSTLSVVSGPWTKFQNSRLFWMKLKIKLEHSLLQLRQIIFGLELVFKSHHKVVGPSHDDNFTAGFVPPLVIHPQIKSVVEINVRKQGTDAPPLRHSFTRLFVDAFVHNTRLQPFSDQADDTVISDSMFNKFYQPLVIQTIEEPLDVTP